ncbi:MAG: 3-phosphoserine/phosphohydroxythreonine transaminase, partial [Candidatus Aureabacteria bacterium]|nr:3-phosphoserine/phosphohydroxythreonine transaminase [Candidatus Auribacterota bacterium]
MGNRGYNFNPGPAVLPEEVLLEAKESIYCYAETGVGILEISHRAPAFEKIVNEAKANVKELLGAGDDFDVLFLQGGASLQFYMVPLNLTQGKVPAYINSGSWSQKAIKEAKRIGKVNVVASSEEQKFSLIPEVKEDQIPKDSPYLHFTSNNTIFGTEFKKEPPSNGVGLVCDASSDFLSRPVDIKRYGLIYAGAQKNVGPAGVVIVVIHKDWIKKSDENLCPMLSYAIHAANNSLYNTPSVFSIYISNLVIKW